MFAGMQDGSRMRVPISPEGFIPGPGMAGQTRFADQLTWCLNERGEVYAHGRWGRHVDPQGKGGEQLSGSSPTAQAAYSVGAGSDGRGGLLGPGRPAGRREALR